MQWKSAEEATFRGGVGTGGQPNFTETMQLIDRGGNVVATFTKGPSNGPSFSLSGLSGLRVAHCTYDFSVEGGVQSTIAPANSDTIPDNAILVGATINSTTAVTSNGSATVAVGTSAGSSTTSIKTATGKASYSADAVLNGVPVFATPVKMTAAGTITFTIGTADLTAGVIEAWVYYIVAAN